MIKPILDFLKYVFIILILLAILYLLFEFVLKDIDKTVQSTMIAAIGTVLASVLAVLYNQRRSKEREIAEAHRPMKIDVYKKFMEMMVELIKGSKQSNPQNQAIITKNLEKGFYEFTRDVIIWGSPSVLKSYSKFRNPPKDQKEYQILIYFDEILREFRNDLGNSNKGIKTGDLIKLFLTDPEKLDLILNKSHNKIQIN